MDNPDLKSLEVGDRVIHTYHGRFPERTSVFLGWLVGTLFGGLTPDDRWELVIGLHGDPHPLAGSMAVIGQSDVLRVWKRGEKLDDVFGMELSRRETKRENEELKSKIAAIRLLFEEKIKTIEGNIANLERDRDAAHARSDDARDFTHELMEQREKLWTLQPLYTEIQGVLAGEKAQENENEFSYPIREEG